MSELNNIALKILSNGKGILAADESTGTMTKRLNSVNVESTQENRLLFRETGFSISEVIFFNALISSVICNPKYDGICLVMPSTDACDL